MNLNTDMEMCGTDQAVFQSTEDCYSLETMASLCRSVGSAIDAYKNARDSLRFTIGHIYTGSLLSDSIDGAAGMFLNQVLEHRLELAYLIELFSEQIRYVGQKLTLLEAHILEASNTFGEDLHLKLINSESILGQLSDWFSQLEYDSSLLLAQMLILQFSLRNSDVLLSLEHNVMQEPKSLDDSYRICELLKSIKSMGGERHRHYYADLSNIDTRFVAFMSEWDTALRSYRESRFCEAQVALRKCDSFGSRLIHDLCLQIKD